MSGDSISKIGKKVVGAEMSTIALNDACKWHDELMDNEFKGRKDKESAARFRLSKKIGVPESYLYRLAYKRRDMRDVAGEVYRRLKQSYDELCAKTEATADAMEAERLQIKAQRNAVDQGPVATGAKLVAAPEGTHELNS